MIAFKIFIKLLPYIWPFLREMVLGNKSIFAALRDNKKKVFFITLVIVSFGLNFLTVPRLLTMSMQYVTLDKRYKELEVKYDRLNSSAKHPGTNGAEQQAMVKKESPVVPATSLEPQGIPKKEDKLSTPKKRTDHVAEYFEKIRQREEKDLLN